MYDFRLFIRNCVKIGKTDEIIKILIEENVIPQGGLQIVNNFGDSMLVTSEYVTDCEHGGVKNEKSLL